jgi:hypothetical protein
MCIFCPKGAGNVPRRHTTIESAWHLSPARGGVSRRTKMCVLPGNAVVGLLQERFFVDFFANEPVTGKR